MKQYADRATEIIDELHTERLDYDSEYLPLINAANQLKAYEDTGLEPEEIKEVQEAMLPIPFGRFHKIMQAEREERCVVLPCKDWMKLVFTYSGPYYMDNGEGEIVKIYVDDETRICIYGVDKYGIGNVSIQGVDEFGNCVEFPPEEVGVSVFRTREEVEASFEGENK